MTPVVVLHLEPDRGEVAMLSSVLRDLWPGTFEWLHAPDAESARDALAGGGVDCVLAPVGALAPLEGVARDVPLVVFLEPGDEDEDRGLAAVRAGAQDVLTRGADGGAVGRALLYAVERTRAAARLRDVERLHEAAMLALGEGVLVLDADGRVTAGNPAAARLLRLPEDRLAELDLRTMRTQLLRPDGTPLPRERWPPLRALASGRAEPRTVVGIHRADGREVWTSMTARPLERAGEPRPYGVVVSIADISDLTRDGVDEVTGLPDRPRFVTELERAAALAARYGWGGTLLVFELDASLSDDELADSAAVLVGRLRGTDLVGRIAARRFGIVLRHVDEGRATHVARALLDLLAARGRTATAGVAVLADIGGAELLALAGRAVGEVRAGELTPG